RTSSTQVGLDRLTQSRTRSGVGASAIATPWISPISGNPSPRALSARSSAYVSSSRQARLSRLLGVMREAQPANAASPIRSAICGHRCWTVRDFCDDQYPHRKHDPGKTIFSVVVTLGGVARLWRSDPGGD